MKSTYQPKGIRPEVVKKILDNFIKTGKKPCLKAPSVKRPWEQLSFSFKNDSELPK